MKLKKKSIWLLMAVIFIIYGFITFFLRKSDIIIDREREDELKYCYINLKDTIISAYCVKEENHITIMDSYYEKIRKKDPQSKVYNKHIYEIKNIESKVSVRDVIQDDYIKILYSEYNEYRQDTMFRFGIVPDTVIHNSLPSR